MKKVFLLIVLSLLMSITFSANSQVVEHDITDNGTIIPEVETTIDSADSGTPEPEPKKPSDSSSIVVKEEPITKPDQPKEEPVVQETEKPEESPQPAEPTADTEKTGEITITKAKKASPEKTVEEESIEISEKQPIASTLNSESLYNQAEEYANKGNYIKAIENYKKAKADFISKGDVEKANNCRFRLRQIEKIMMDYPFTDENVATILAENFKNIPEAVRNSWVTNGKLDSIIIDGKPVYAENFAKNLIYRNMDLAKKDADFQKNEAIFFKKYHDMIFRFNETGNEQNKWQVFINPKRFLAMQTLSIPRDKLPKDGVLKLWFPLPILTAAQNDVRLISVTPDKYMKLPPQLNSDLGLAYMEIPLNKITEDINISMQFSFNHFQQHFIIDPQLIGEYDKESEFYKHYTRSFANTEITPEIKQKALEIVGNEKNAYLAAKKIYNFIIENISYSLMPHLSLDSMNIPESQFALKNLYGDCGTQSMLFSAMLRSLGIPSRTTGGWQLCPEHESTHFWAEFYLPNYGWIPVDTSMAQTVNYVSSLTDNQKEKFKEFFFGNQDPYRWVIQNDVDIPVTPLNTEPLFFPMVIQFPAAECSTMDEDPTKLVFEHWKVEFNQM